MALFKTSAEVINICYDINHTNLQCFECEASIQKIHLHIKLFNGNYIRYCEKCAFNALEKQIALHEFFIYDLKLLSNTFPKKKSRKKKERDISLNIMKNL